ncbi:MAG: deoxyribonuclease IV [Candidatus Omnitrophica bacterium]|nr:deoxyribonuclease IV [Candidatus Omnitrophota bacterium]
MLKLGCQVSISGKIYESIDRAKLLGCNTMQIFTRNPRQWRKTNLSEEDIKIFKNKAGDEKIKPIVAHIPYTLNLAAFKKRFHKITIREFTQDLIEVDKLGIQYLVTHMGSHKGLTETEGLLRVVEALKKILEDTPKVKTIILLENTSGSGSWLGYKFVHQHIVLEKLNWTDRIGLCLDTAHAWAAGYKINDLGGLNNLLDEIEREVGIERLKIIHLNDTKEKLNSRKDRHFDIAKGFIGYEGFYHILNHPKLKNLPFILETPKKSDKDDIRNLETVRRLSDGIF